MNDVNILTATTRISVEIFIKNIFACSIDDVVDQTDRCEDFFELLQMRLKISRQIANATIDIEQQILNSVIF